MDELIRELTGITVLLITGDIAVIIYHPDLDAKIIEHNAEALKTAGKTVISLPMAAAWALDKRLQQLANAIEKGLTLDEMHEDDS